MAKRSKKRSKGKKKSAKRSSPTVTVRFANPGRRRTMAKRRRRTRKNPANPANPRRRLRHNPKPRHHRRRRNPETFAQRAGKLAFGAVIAVGTGVGVTYAASKIMPGSNVSMYGIPALTFLAGVGIARTMPTLGVGMALGSFAPFVVPVTTKLLTATQPATPAATTAAAGAAGIARAYRRMNAVHMGRGVSAVNMNAVHMGRG
jgi:hypothetical protein